MPHSSGGGGHGGGGHGGHGGSSGRTSARPFAGASRYFYYDRGMPVEVYSNYDLTKDRRKSQIVTIAVFASLIPFIIIISLAAGFHNPRKLKTNDYDTSIVIRDEADVLSGAEEIRLRHSLLDFYEETGITPAVFTVNNEDWEDDYSNLEKYAYDLYVDAFEDEKHWLIVYSEPEDPDPDFNDWYWEGMQGDYTDGILNTRYTNRFNKLLQKELLKRNKYTVGEAITDAFDDLTPVIMTKYFDWLTPVLLDAIFLPIFGVAILSSVLDMKKNQKMLNAVKVPVNEVVEQEKCIYCGGVYIKGHHQACPHCGAQVEESGV